MFPSGHMTIGIIDYLHPYNLPKRLEHFFKDVQHEMKLRAASPTIQKASEYKRRFRVAADHYFTALPSSASEQVRYLIDPATDKKHGGSSKE